MFEQARVVDALGDVLTSRHDVIGTMVAMPSDREKMATITALKDIHGLVEALWHRLEALYGLPPETRNNRKQTSRATPDVVDGRIGGTLRLNGDEYLLALETPTHDPDSSTT